MTTDNAELKTEEVNEQETNLPFNMNQRNFNNNKQKNSRRPSLIINQHPENDITPRKLKTVPGNCTYGDAVRYGKKTYIVGTSMVKGIKMKEFSNHLHGAFAKIRPFSGASIKQLAYYTVPILVDDLPNRIIIHGSCNGVGNRNETRENIAINIKNLAKTCCEYGVNDVFISSIIYRRNKFLNEKVDRINFLLHQFCIEEGFYFINNGNIDTGDLWNDGLHLQEKEKVK